MCDVQTVDSATDLIETDVIFRDGYTENMSVYSNPNMKWYYLNKQGAEEILIFRQSDTIDQYMTGKLCCLANNDMNADAFII
jgi:hypothetical protein